MKANDLQFVRHLVRYEMDLPEDLCSSILNQNIEVIPGHDPEKIQIENGTILYSNPKNISKFLFNCSYHSIVLNSPKINRDKLALGIVLACKEYVYENFDKQIKLPSLIDFDKIEIPNAIISNFIEPLVGKIKKPKILFTSCCFTSCCRFIESPDKFYRTYPAGKIVHSDFPFILCNIKIHNEPARLADMLCKVLEINFGPDKTSKIISKLLLNNDLFDMLVMTVKYLHHDPFMPADFVKYLQSYGTSESETKDKYAFQTVASIESYLKSDSRSGIIKESAEKYTPQVWNQWSQWSMLMGLIEKQLSPMRGSMWPTTENMKKHDDVVRQALRDRAKQKNKNILNMEEMLEVARDIFNHNAHEPGNLIEILNGDNRVWK